MPNSAIEDPPWYSHAIVCSWSTSGMKLTSDTLTPTNAGQGFRLAVKNGRLLVSADSGMSSPNVWISGPVPISKEVWRFENKRFPKDEVTVYPEEGFELERGITGALIPGSIRPFPSFTGDVLGREFHGQRVIQGMCDATLFFKSPESLFPWKAHPGRHFIQTQWRYRGSSEELSNGISWGNALLYTDLDGNLWSMSVKE